MTVTNLLTPIFLFLPKTHPVYNVILPTRKPAKTKTQNPKPKSKTPYKSKDGTHPTPCHAMLSSKKHQWTVHYSSSLAFSIPALLSLPSSLLSPLFVSPLPSPLLLSPSPPPLPSPPSLPLTLTPSPPAQRPSRSRQCGAPWPGAGQRREQRGSGRAGRRRRRACAARRGQMPPHRRGQARSSRSSLRTWCGRRVSWVDLVLSCHGEFVHCCLGGSEVVMTNHECSDPWTARVERASRRWEKSNAFAVAVFVMIVAKKRMDGDSICFEDLVWPGLVWSGRCDHVAGRCRSKCGSRMREETKTGWEGRAFEERGEKFAVALVSRASKYAQSAVAGRADSAAIPRSPRQRCLFLRSFDCSATPCQLNVARSRRQPFAFTPPSLRFRTTRTAIRVRQAEYRGGPFGCVLERRLRHN